MMMDGFDDAKKKKKLLLQPCSCPSLVLFALVGLLLICLVLVLSLYYSKIGNQVMKIEKLVTQFCTEKIRIFFFQHDTVEVLNRVF